MRRIQFLEIEDHIWCPAVFRNLITDYLQYFAEILWPYDKVVELVEKALLRMDSRQIIDLCSGASGPWPRIASQAKDLSVVLTDKYPNLDAFRRISAESNGHIQFVTDPVDATNVPDHLQGMRTIFAGFHHFQPEIAKSILQDAAKKGTAIGIFEFTARRLHTFLSALIGIPVMVGVLTLFIRPLRFSRLFWTYCIPIAPLLILWDGLVSHLRTYSVLELEDLVDALEESDYKWEIGKHKSPLPGVQITYLLGYPTKICNQDRQKADR